MTEMELSSKQTRYVMDSNCIIEGRNSVYAKDIFPSLWRNVEDLVANGELYIPKEVINELTVKYDDPASWVKTQQSKIKPLSDEQQSGINDAYAKLVNQWPNKSEGADLWVISAAKVLEATVVTQEKPPGKDKIPTICHEMGLDCISLMELMRREGWAFR